MTVSAVTTISVTIGGVTRRGTITKTAGTNVTVSETIPGDSTDLLVAFACDVSQLQSLYMKSDKALTVETNDGTTPQETITLVAGEPIYWAKTNTLVCPFSGDITALYVTETNSDDAELEIEAIIDPTV
jgi:hypothetical protein